MIMQIKSDNVFDVPTNQTLEFVLKFLPRRNLRILEVGCGNGELAECLQNLGFEVVAVDSSLEAVEKTKQRGVEARVAEFPNFDENAFDAILFTRSLHHLQALDETIAKTHQLLNPNGVVLVEDFAFNEANEATIEWLYGVVSLLEICGQLNLTEDNFAKDLLLGKGNYQVWRENHHHHLHSAPIMLKELKSHFELTSESDAPYLYRYFCLLLNKNPKGYELAAQILKLEQRMAALGNIDLIGRRFVGTKSGSKTTYSKPA